MRRRHQAWWLLILLALAGCSGKGDSTTPIKGGAPDQSTPMATVNALLQAARSGNSAHLAYLCHPNAHAGADVRRICELTDTTMVSSGFVHSFRNAEALPPCAEGEGMVTLLYGPAGDKCGEMLLMEADGNWYLQDLR